MSRLFPAQPIVGVGIVIWRDSRVLLIRRGKPPRAGQWSLPGGAQELGETVFEAARREAKEETGLDIEVLGLLDVVDSIRKEDDGRVKQHYTLVDVYAAAPVGKAIAGDDAQDAAWFDIDKIESLGLWSETERIIFLAYEKWQASHS
ncbi:MAG: NUDIX hydrolase [Rhodospirillaceae bacterium]|jgi:8-oxo-dGTP diphosphatase